MTVVENKILITITIFKLNLLFYTFNPTPTINLNSNHLQASLPFEKWDIQALIKPNRLLESVRF